MFQAVVTGEISGRLPALSNDAKEKFWGSFYLKEIFWIDGAQFARHWTVFVPSYLSKSAEKLIVNGRRIGVQFSDIRIPEQIDEQSLRFTGIIRADQLFIL